MPIDLNPAILLHRQGELDRAAQLYQAALQHDPNHPDALHLLGLVSLQQNDPRQAEILISQAVAIRPREPSFHANLAEAQWSLAQAARAIDSCRVAIELDPTNAAYHTNLGSMVMSQGDLDSAIELFETAVRLNPRIFPAHNNLGNALRQRGQLARARHHLELAIELEPSSPEARSNLGIILLDQGHPEMALEHSRTAVRLRPGSPVYHNNLGNVLHTLGRLEEACTSFRAAIQLDPKLAPAHAALGGSLENLGEVDASIAAMREAVRLDPNHADALARLATRLRKKLEPAERESLHRLVASPELPDVKRWTLLFGLSQVLDDEKQFEQAAAISAQANHLQRADFQKKGNAYDPAHHHQFVSDLLGAFNPGFFRRFQGAGSPRPIFVLGMPRSGTTLVEQILASHPSVFGAGELSLLRQSFLAIAEHTTPALTPTQCIPLLDQRVIERLAERHLRKLTAINATADHIVDKMPENYLYLGLIATLFPQAKVIHCRRDLRDTALSCWLTHFARLRWACSPTDIGSRIEEYLRLMNHWRTVLPIEFLDVDYESMIGDTEGSCRRLLAWCGLDWHPACLDFHKTRRPVQTASVVQVRQPIYSNSVARWKSYEPFLPQLFDAVPSPPVAAK